MTTPPPLTPVQRAALLSADAPARLKHFVGQAADWERVWGLRNDSGWVALADAAGAEGFPVWPHPEYAKACAEHDWADCAPVAIDVHEFVDGWLPDMVRRGVSIAVFPTPALRGVWLSAAELGVRLADELARYE